MTEAAPMSLASSGLSAGAKEDGRSWLWPCGDHRIVLVALRCWQLAQNGFGNEYYSAGVRGMLEGWHNFFFNSFDPAGFVSLDKPPVAFWIQARARGFSA